MQVNKVDIDSIIKKLKSDNMTNAVVRTDFVEFMENVKDPYIVLICCILSLRTNDKTTYPAAMRMLELGKTPNEIMNLEVDTLCRAIYPVGFYRNKAGQIIEL